MIEFRRSLEPFTVADTGTRGDDGGVTVSGHAAVFNSEAELMPGLFEIIAPGAFADALRAHPSVPLLQNHDVNILLARSPGTMRIREDARGLRIVAELPDTYVGQHVATSIRRGDLHQMSFAMSGIVDRWEPRGSRGALRTIVSVGQVHDVSAVVAPAYTSTSIGVVSDGRSRSTNWTSLFDDIDRRRQPRLNEHLRRRLALVT